MNNKLYATSLINWLFGITVFAIGIVNTFWGNDAGFGIFLLLLSFVYFLPVSDILKRMTGFSVPRIEIVKIALGVFIVWSALGVGELFTKIDMMSKSFQ